KATIGAYKLNAGSETVTPVGLGGVERVGGPSDRAAQKGYRNGQRRAGPHAVRAWILGGALRPAGCDGSRYGAEPVVCAVSAAGRLLHVHDHVDLRCILGWDGGQPYLRRQHF